MSFSVLLEPDEEGRGYTVIVPALPGCYTRGETRQEAISMAKEAIELYLESCKANKEPIPEEKGIVSLVVEVREPVA